MAQKIKADKDFTLLKQLLQVSDILFKIMERDLLSQNLSATAADILFFVDAMGEDVTPAKISRMMLREPISIRQLLARMEKHGLVERTKNMEHKNQIRVMLTAKGEKARRRAMKKEGATGIISRLSDVQQKQLKATLTTLKEAGKKELRLSPKALLWP